MHTGREGERGWGGAAACHAASVAHVARPSATQCRSPLAHTRGRRRRTRLYLFVPFVRGGSRRPSYPCHHAAMHAVLLLAMPCASIVGAIEARRAACGHWRAARGCTGAQPAHCAAASACAALLGDVCAQLTARSGQGQGPGSQKTQPEERSREPSASRVPARGRTLRCETDHTGRSTGRWPLAGQSAESMTDERAGAGVTHCAMSLVLRSTCYAITLTSTAINP